MKWTNWSGAVECRPEKILSPSSEDEILHIVKAASTKKKCIRVFGSGHSFTPLVKNNEILISLDNWQGIIDIDKNNNEVTVRSGTKLKLLGELLFHNGFSQENLGDINAQSIAGAISTGTHGSGINFGSIATQVRELTIVTGSGETIHCSETENREIFKAAQVSMGTMGIITRVKLKCLPAYKLKYVSSKESLEACISKLEEYKKNNRNFEFYFFPFTETVQVKIMNTTEENAKDGGIGKFLNDMLLENGLFKILSEACRIFPAACKLVSGISAWGISTGTNVNWSHRVFATPRLVKFQEMEYNIPTEHFVSAIREIKEAIVKNNVRVHFPIECRFVKSDDIYLSPASGRESAYIAVHMYKGMPYKEYFSLIENIFKKYNGRPHWGKMHTRSAAELSPLYPQWNKFNELRKHYDREGVFMNEYLRKVLG